ncbi:His/Gly/Thr/Pro-type tRNA ligase C-terminal domain-containing protein [Parachlamydia sp. AcF125]|uniref:His/Gly/Thr/Pro-type tRNA ligase C-terminal domain-containing protein n=1 Tax=Parachlamydia sp. AcF125 TaxID=2795736 RepID=UPI001BC8F1FA|nr:His/Gly/Thr/Pro-type tRNA ligase C-terminal domain-containing protein [Parachlamydia sp. AcF125]MBS4168564.1 Threonine--tRNA ligase 1 [Parachlamydia sp. AcF125]
MNFIPASLRLLISKLLGCVLRDLFPNVQLVQGNSNQFGFYYDCLFSQPITEELLPLIEERLWQLCKNPPLIQEMHMMRENAVHFFQHHGQPFHAQLVENMEENIVELIRIADFYDLYSAQEVPDPAVIKALKMLSCDEKEIYHPSFGKVRVTRICGIAFLQRDEMKAFLKRWTSYKKKHHLELGKEMELFLPLDEASWIWLPRGESLRKAILAWCENGYAANGYQKIGMTGLLPVERFTFKPSFEKKIREQTWMIEKEEEEYILPSKQLSPAFFAASAFQTFPLRFFESETRFAGNASEKLEGLLKSRTCEMSQASLFCLTEQVLDELISSLQFIEKTVKVFGFEAQWYLYPKAEKNAAAKKQWPQAIAFLHEALKLCYLDYQVEETSSSWRGPRIEVKLVDLLNRQWKGPQLEFDLLSSESFALASQAKGQQITPWVIRWTALGSTERWIALLIEQNEGRLPFWLAPEQVRIFPVGEKVMEYAKKVQGLIKNQDLRVAIDKRQHPLAEKIYEATRQRVPYLVILGDKEERENRLTVRSFDDKTAKADIAIEDFLTYLRKENLFQQNVDDKER